MSLLFITFVASAQHAPAANERKCNEDECLYIVASNGPERYVGAIGLKVYPRSLTGEDINTNRDDGETLWKLTLTYPFRDNCPGKVTSNSLAVPVRHRGGTSIPREPTLYFNASILKLIPVSEAVDVMQGRSAYTAKKSEPCTTTAAAAATTLKQPSSSTTKAKTAQTKPAKVDGDDYSDANDDDDGNEKNAKRPNTTTTMRKQLQTPETFVNMCEGCDLTCPTLKRQPAAALSSGNHRNSQGRYISTNHKTGSV